MASKNQILRRPLITEKSAELREINRYVIEVDPDASKGQIRQAVETRFKVDVVSVHTVALIGKFRRRFGPIGGYRSDRKKAIVKIKAGQQITWDEVA